jgi:hypothetical protein
LTQQEERSSEEVKMLRKLGVLVLTSSLAIATGLPVVAQVVVQGKPAQGMPQGMPMGSMRTTKDPADQKKSTEPEFGPNQAQAPTLERVTPTYHDTTEDRIMREKTDDGAHDRNDTQR